MTVTFNSLKNGRTLYRTPTCLTQANLMELLEEIGYGPTTRRFHPTHLVEAIEVYRSEKGWVDKTDWLDKALEHMFRISIVAETHEVDEICAS